MSTEESRKALREFYKLREARAEPPPQHEVDELTEVAELDGADVDVDAYVARAVQEHGLAAFVALVEQIRKERNALASAQRELVNDNYKKLIQAAETLGYLSSQGDLAGLEALQAPVHTFAALLAKLPPETPSR